ncbi:hypothetical protein A3K86_21820 [Photobacterium jeanii]|uniref:Uncharacterized protein n=2 Tax=Photobacterium jeanii TaxID=858640 RepID=A0A178K493_9GAMM|nr:YdbH domain-containing protein [Photobacterium jeanii]OAN11564.1 hypothetical protein A3K86_21820 [Photobacterium jeanii]PST91086.1 hypothetical protein C9I91_10925 [Photobacterium jeanii]
MITLIAAVIIVPLWLASKGIIINAISGIKIYPQIKIDRLSVSIAGTQINTHQLSINKYFNEQSAISSESWRIQAQHAEVALPLEAQQVLKDIGLDFPYFELNQPAINFADLGNPYVFSAHTESIRAHLIDPNTVDINDEPIQQSFSAKKHTPKSITNKPIAHKPITQELQQINLVIATKPYVTITGTVERGRINLFVPKLGVQDQVITAAANAKSDNHGKQRPQQKALNDNRLPSPRYPVTLNKGNFSIAWQQDTNPLHISVERLTPEWQSLPPITKQHAEDVQFEMDIYQPTKSIKLHAKSMTLGRPAELPTFIQRPANEQRGLHLGETIANLATLPFNTLKVNKLTYGDLIINAKVVLKTPLKRSETKQRHAQFKLNGQVLAPNPYDLDMLLIHQTANTADFSGKVKGPKGNTLNCDANIEFDDPLPKTLHCEANFKNTKDLMERFALEHLPTAELNAPFRVTANRVENTKYNQVVDRKLIDAYYKLAITLPPELTVRLNRFSLPGKHFAQDAPIEVIHLTSDGELDLAAHYKNERVSIRMTDKQESLKLRSVHNDKLNFNINKLSCKHPKLQCHLKGNYALSINQLALESIAIASRVKAQSQLAFDWTTDSYQLALTNTTITSDNIKIEPQLHAKTFNSLSAEQIESQIASITLDKRSEQAAVSLITGSSSDTLSAVIKAQQVVKDEFGQPVVQSHNTKRHLLPVQQYESKTELKLNSLQMRIPNPTDSETKSHLPTFDSRFEFITHFKQNDQRFPRFSSHNHFKGTLARWQLESELKNWKSAPLAKVAIHHHQPSQTTKLKLQRHTIAFNRLKTLKKYYLPQLPLDYDFTHGSISYDGQFTINPNQIIGNLGIFTHQLSGDAYGFRFGNLNTSITTSLTPQGLKSRYPISIQAGLFHAGALFENIAASLEFDTARNHYQLHRASANVLGGKISLHGLKTNNLVNVPPHDIRVHGLNLALLINMLDQEDIELTGILDGVIPLGIEDGSAIIKSGHLHSRYPGGILRYLEGSTIDQNVEAAGQNSVLVVGKILKNYNYHSLAVDLDYSKEGQLNASSRFKGFNPSFQKGRPVHLNLNVQDDIPALIKTINAINSSQLEGLFLKQLGLNE